MKILSRYIFKEMVPPTILGFSFYTFIILMRQLFDFAGMIIKRSLPAETIGRLLLLSLPHIVVLTVPMSLLFGILIAVGRLSADSEVVAMRALGISTRTIYRPVFLFSFLMFVLSLYLMNVVLPRGNTQLNQLRAEVFTSSIEKEIKPRVFYAEYETLVIYVNDIDPATGLWKGVFVSDSSGEESKPAPATVSQQVEAAAAAENAVPFSAARSSTRVIVAESGTLSIVQPSKQIWMNLNNAETHVWDPRKPDRYDRTINVSQRMKLPDKFGGDAGTGVYVRSMRELNLKELIDQANVAAHMKGPVFEDVYRMSKVEIHKKFAIPFACLVFGILGLPLGITNRRGGKSSGFSLSIAILLFYYILINNGEAMAQSGRVSPAVGMWTPNVILLIVGIYLLARANRESGFKSDRAPIWRRIGDALTTRRAANAPPRPVASAAQIALDEDEPAILNRLDITFPNILDRYILREFIKVLSLVLISTIALFVIVDYTDLAHDIRANQIAFHTVLAYYRFNIFQILHWTLPIAVLVATLVTFGILSKNNEVTALKSGGVSLYRVALPIIFIAVIIAGLAYLMLDFVPPYANQRVDQLRNKIRGKGPVAMQSASQPKLWFLGKNGRYIINFLAYDNNAKQLSQVQVLEFHPTEFRLTRRVYAERATGDGRGWVFERGWMRSFGDDGRTVYTPITAPLRLYYAERPDDFATEVKSPDQMTFAQLRRYIETIRRSGYAAEELTVKLYEKTSWPFISVVMALIALPFAFKMGRRGALYGFFIALVLGIAYWGVFSIFTKFGEVGNLPGLLAAWSANILFAIAAIYLFLHVET